MYEAKSIGLQGLQTEMVDSKTSGFWYTVGSNRVYLQYIYTSRLICSIYILVGLFAVYIYIEKLLTPTKI